MRLLKRSFLGLITLASIVAVDPSRAAEGPRDGAPATIDEVRRAVHARDNRIVSLAADFRSWHRSNVGTDHHERYRLAAKAGRRLQRLWHGGYSDPEDDPRAYAQLLDGEHWNVLNTHFRRYDVSRNLATHPYTDKIVFHPFLEALGWWPPGEAAPPPRREGRRIFLGDLVDDERCRVAGREMVDGSWCDIIEIPGSDRLWMDLARGVVPRRVFLSGDDSAIATIESGDFREVAPGLYLPYRIRRVQRANDFDFTTVVDRYEVNATADDEFRLEIAPGTVVYDRDTDTYRQVPGGFLVMDRLSSWGKEHCPPPDRPGDGRSTGIAVWGLGGIAAGGLVTRLRRRRSRGGDTINELRNNHE